MLVIVYYAFFFGITLSVGKFHVAARIINGWYAVTGEYPYIVSIQEGMSNRQRCGGCILSSMFVLTACQCFKIFKADGKQNNYDKNDIIVIAGSSDRLNGERRQIRAPHLIFIHPLCEHVGQGEIIYNVAAVKVNWPFYFNARVMPANFISTNIEIDRNKGHYNDCVGAGWGGSMIETWRDYKQPSPLLKMAEIVVWDREACTKWLCAKNTFYCTTKEYILLCGISLNNDGCIGDYGGPLICNDFIFGVISWEPTCAEREEPAVFENFKNIYDFIRPVLDNLYNIYI